MNTKVIIPLWPFALTFTFILAVLKLTGLVAVSWWVVTLPLWFIPAVVLGIFLLTLTFGVLAVLIDVALGR